MANFQLHNALCQARIAGKRLDLPCRVPFTDIPLQQMEKKEHVTVLDLDPEQPSHEMDMESEDIEISSVVTSSGSVMMGLMGLDLKNVDNQLLVRHCPPMKSELSDAKLFVLHEELDALDSEREKVQVPTVQDNFKKPSRKPLTLRGVTCGGITSNTS